MTFGDVVWLVVFAAATARATRLITADYLFERFRVWADGRSQWLGYLVSCDWCLSLWFAVPAAIGWAVYRENVVVQVVAVALTFSLIAGRLANSEADR